MTDVYQVVSPEDLEAVILAESFDLLAASLATAFIEYPAARRPSERSLILPKPTRCFAFTFTRFAFTRLIPQAWANDHSSDGGGVTA